MNPSNVPPWGCPWHGPVQGGVLTLPNGATMAWPQPPAAVAQIGGAPKEMPDTYGTTHRIKVPGVADVARSPAELAADQAAGREWRSDALLAGGRQQLYGRTLDGWLYIDPDGVRWRVSCPALHEDVLHPFGAALNASVTLSRFGEFGRAPESYSYPISLADWQQSGEIEFSETGGRLMVDAINSSGSAVVLLIHRRRLMTADPMVRWPLGFLELTLSGPGAQAVMELRVARSRAQTLQLARSFDLGEGYQAGWYSGPPSYSAQWRVQLASTPPGPGEGNFAEWGGRALSIYSGAVSLDIRRLLALWYDANDTLVEVAFVLAWSGSITMPAPTEGAEHVTSGSATWSATIEVGALACGTVTGAWTATTTETVDQSGNGTYSMSATITVDGVDYPISAGGAIFAQSWAPLAYDDAWLYSAGMLDPYWFEQRAFESTGFSGRLALVRYSGQVLGLRVQRGGEHYAYHPVATPAGAHGSVTLRAQALERLYGSYSATTQQTRWLETSPVCYV
jgi:hypothetical protein